MAEPLNVDWKEIQRVWENSKLGDAALAARFGFASKTSVKRKRIADGWKRDEAAIDALATAGAIEAVKASEPRVPGGDTKRAQGKTQADQGVKPAPAVAVPPKMGANTSVSRPGEAHARDEPPDPVAVVQAEQVEATTRQLRLARRLQAVGDKLVGALEGVLSGPMLGGTCDPGEELEGPNTPYGLAIITLKALNPEKDSLNALLKVAGEAIAKGIELERKTLKMDAPAATGEPGGSVPAGLLTAEQFVELHRERLDVLEALNDVTAAITRDGGSRARPATIEGQSERIK